MMAIKKVTPYWVAQRIPKAHERRTAPNTDIYNSKRWRKLSKAMAHEQPLCVMCLERGEVRPSEMTDHIQPINAGGAVYDRDNLQRLCNKCHAVKSGSEAHTKKLQSSIK